MFRRMQSVILVLALLLPAAAIGESAPLPFGLKMGMDQVQAEAAFSAAPSLSTLSPDKVTNEDGTVEYVYDNVPVPGADDVTASLVVDIDQNNSKHINRLTSISLEINPKGNCIALFRTLLQSMTKTFGTPSTDPFDENGTAGYVEWGTLDASWATDDVRISLSMSRMFGDSLSILYSSRLNYDPADLAE